MLGDGAGYELLDPEVVESGLSEMMVSLNGSFAGAVWQPYEPQVTLAIPDGDYFVVYVKVRDGAGNESQTAALPIRIEDDWPSGNVLVGLQSWLVEHGSSVAGDIAVIEPSSDEDAWELVLAQGSTIEGSARADGVVLLHDAAVSGNVCSNTLSSSGLVSGEYVTPIGVAVYLRLPRMPDVEPGGTNVAVGKADLVELEPGSYGDLVLANGKQADPTELLLTGGVYHIGSLRAGKNARVACAAPCELRVAATLWFDKEGYLGPEGAEQPANDVGIFVAGADAGADADEDVVHTSNDGVVRARIAAPEGRLRFAEGVTASGAFVAPHLRVGHGAQISRDGL